jgi:hypothetical protein
VASALDKDIENEAFLVSRTPEPVLLAGDGDDDDDDDDNLVQMHLAPQRGTHRRMRLANFRPNSIPPDRIVSYVTEIPRAASISSPSQNGGEAGGAERRLSG